MQTIPNIEVCALARYGWVLLMYTEGWNRTTSHGFGDRWFTINRLR